MENVLRNPVADGDRVLTKSTCPTPAVISAEMNKDYPHLTTGIHVNAIFNQQRTLKYSL